MILTTLSADKEKNPLKMVSAKDIDPIYSSIREGLKWI